MNINTENNNGICSMKIEGEMTIFTADDLMKQMSDNFAGCSGVEMDLSQVSEMDTAGFQLLYLAKKESDAMDRTFRIMSHSQAVLSVLELFKIDKEVL